MAKMPELLKNFLSDLQSKEECEEILDWLNEELNVPYKILLVVESVMTLYDESPIPSQDFVLSEHS